MSAPTPRIILLFVDGLGVGAHNAAINPLAARSYPAIERMTGGASLTGDAQEITQDGVVYRAIDATLGVDGLPQSGTGQATLFTGVNCAKLAGRHYGPFPHSSSRTVIRESNLFADASGVARLPAVFANAYPDRFFRYVARTKRWTVTTLCCSVAGIPLRTAADLAVGAAVSADITGRSWPEPDSTHEIIEPQEAGRRLTRLSEDASLTVFEYFATDKAGHAQHFGQAEEALIQLDGLVEGILCSLKPFQTLVMTSDHGNTEDLSVKTHTRNAVPLLAHGPAAHRFRDVNGLTDVKPAILSALADEG